MCYSTILRIFGISAEIMLNFSEGVRKSLFQNLTKCIEIFPTVFLVWEWLPGKDTNM